MGQQGPKCTQMDEDTCQGFRGAGRNFFSFTIQAVALTFPKVCSQFAPRGPKFTWISSVQLISYFSLIFSTFFYLFFTVHNFDRHCRNDLFALETPQNSDYLTFCLQYNVHFIRFYHGFSVFWCHIPQYQHINHCTASCPQIKVLSGISSVIIVQETNKDKQTKADRKISWNSMPRIPNLPVCHTPWLNFQHFDAI